MSLPIMQIMPVPASNLTCVSLTFLFPSAL